MLPDGIERGQKLSTLVAQEIADRFVFAGQSASNLEEGVRLPTEQGMMDEFKVGRTTVREALRLLESRGLISIRPGRTGGPVTRRPRVESLTESLTLILQVEQASLRDVIDARLALEPMMAAMAAERISEEQLDQLQDTVTQMRKFSDDDAVFAESNWRFHSLLSTAADSVVLRIYLETLRTIADGTLAGVEYSPEKHSATADAHERIITSLRQRAKGGAHAAMREHVEEVSAFWTKRYPELMSKPVRWRL